MRAPTRGRPSGNPTLSGALSRLLAAVQSRPPSPERMELLLLLKAECKLADNRERILELCETLDLYAERVLTGEELSDAAEDVFGQKVEGDPWAA